MAFSEYVHSALARIAESERFTNYQISANVLTNSGDNYFSSIVFVKISGKKKSKEKDAEAESLHVVMKLPGTILVPRSMQPITQYFSREQFVYQHFLPELSTSQNNVSKEKRFHHAKCFEASCKCEEEILVLENLKEKKYKMYDRTKSVDYAHSFLIIKKIAHFHAMGFALKHKNPEFNRRARSHAFGKDSFSAHFRTVLEQCARKFVDCIRDADERNLVGNYCENIYEKVFELLDLNDEEEKPYNVFCHGDLWINNVMFTYENDKPTDLILVDWQMFKYASPITDLAYFLFMCTDQAFRTKHLDDIFETYYGTLKESLKDMDCDPESCFPEKVFRDHLEKKLSYGLAIGVVLIPVVVQEKDVDVKSWGKSKKSVGFANVKYTEYTVDRINGVVKDMIRLKLI